MGVKKKVKQSLPYSIGISIFNLFISLFGMVYLVRYLDEIEYGAMGLFTGLPFMLNIAISLGWDNYITRFIPALEDKKEIGTKFWQILIPNMALASAICLVLVLGYDWWATSFQIGQYKMHFIAFQGSLLSTFGFVYVQKMLNARFMQKHMLYSRIAYQALRLGSIIWGIQTKQDFLYFMYAFSVVDTIYFFIGIGFVVFNSALPNFRDLFRRLKETPDEKSYRRVSYVNKIGTSFLGTDIDRYVLGYFSNPTQVAIYVLATRVLTKLMDFYPEKMFKPVSEPAFFSKYDTEESDKKEAEVNRMFQFMFNANNIIGFLFLAILLPLGKDFLILVFEKDYTADAYFPLIVFLIFLVFYSIPLGMVAQAIKKPMILLYSKLTIIFNIATGIPMAYLYGATGMAISTAASVFLKNLMIYYMTRRHINVQIPWSSAIKSMLNTLISAGITYGLKLAFPINLYILAVIATILYFIVMKFNPILTEPQRVVFFELVPKKVRKVVKFVF
ncbi:MAG: oligosaccharide flippase family protein [Bacteroidia bacterium]|nr:oligosaccharide flippase family protein [Bacteroidia bacterium]